MSLCVSVSEDRTREGERREREENELALCIPRTILQIGEHSIVCLSKDIPILHFAEHNVRFKKTFIKGINTGTNGNRVSYGVRGERRGEKRKRRCRGDRGERVREKCYLIPLLSLIHCNVLTSIVLPSNPRDDRQAHII